MVSKIARRQVNALEASFELTEHKIAQDYDSGHLGRKSIIVTDIDKSLNSRRVDVQARCLWGREKSRVSGARQCLA